MWSILNGTIVNAVAVLVGSAAGLALGGRLPERYQRIILDALGLVTITLGIDAAVIIMGDTVAKYRPAGAAGQTYGARLGMVMVASLVLGSIIGTALRLHGRLEGLGGAIHRWFGRRAAADSPRDASNGLAVSQTPSSHDGAKFAEAFLSASVIFCVGPLTLLGCMNNGMIADPSLLYIKSFLDLFCSAALASSLGAGVMGSILTIVGFQGGLSLVAAAVGDVIPPLSVQMMNVVGGVLLLATALSLLEIRKIPVANMLPAIILPPAIIWISEQMAPGALMTHL